MRAAVYYNNRDVRIEERPVPTVLAGEALVRIEASGICGSDVMEWYRIKKAPLVLGHEIAGTIVETGAGVERFKAGDRVTVAHHVPCNSCRYCLAGNHSVCDTLRSTNFDPGGFCEFVRVPAINLDRGTFILPDSVSFGEGTFAEPLGCVVRAFRMARFTPGMNVLVIGSGMSGLLHIKLAKALGAGKIISTDINDFRLKAARGAGADLALRADADVPGAVRGALGTLADLVIICAASDPAITQGLGSVDRGGTVIFFAPKEPGGTYPLPLFDLWRDNITIINSYASPPYDTEVALGLIAAKRVDVSDMITHRLGLAEAPDGFRLAAEARESIKVIIEPQR
ncbi:MAG TPA: alcohol dehydrogenase [Deltaproteobacteria bacterium]|nr:MAG: alcohol dehydrogenase [Deltaproteobacteria bacterium GWA2_55_82]OGQ62396.1 MAG: alcohol dehydrogenase [Deltaproteobacteria bacterium RIFCSPLOWO2_02_FULL_55_12]OIJ73308.1 MAG: alcohol dehydrogenase [Deltaproteobacteria bacterium GWC2_55_46]HBG45422.1 alcohol dehydrogenase [Deltaproteobacteria bacterium]HCY10253.1 alcohol dehydrogenase [Deltaproteobacteria bacterium]